MTAKLKLTTGWDWVRRFVRKFRRKVPMEWNLPVPPVDFTKSTFHFSINYTVWMGNASLCFCDRKDRAEWVARAFNGWLQTDDGKAWLAEMGFPNTSVSYDRPQGGN